MLTLAHEIYSRLKPSQIRREWQSLQRRGIREYLAGWRQSHQLHLSHLNWRRHMILDAAQPGQSDIEVARGLSVFFIAKETTKILGPDWFLWLAYPWYRRHRARLEREYPYACDSPEEQDEQPVEEWMQTKTGWVPWGIGCYRVKDKNLAMQFRLKWGSGQ